MGKIGFYLKMKDLRIASVQLLLTSSKAVLSTPLLLRLISVIEVTKAMFLHDSEVNYTSFA